MRFLRNLFLAVPFLVLTVSAVVFASSFALVSSISSSLVMTLVQEAGGTESLVRQVAEHAAPRMTDDRALQAGIVKAALRVVRPEVVRTLAGQLMDGVRRALVSGGSDLSGTIDLRPIKADVLAEAKTNFPKHLDDVEKNLEQVPDRPTLSSLFPPGSLQGFAQPCRIAANLPLASAIVALACVGLMLLLLGWSGGGLRLGGISLIIGGVLVTALTVMLEKTLVKDVLNGFRSTMSLGDLTLDINPRAVAGAAFRFVIGRARLVSGICMGLGLILSVVHKRKDMATPSTPT